VQRDYGYLNVMQEIWEHVTMKEACKEITGIEGSYIKNYIKITFRLFTLTKIPLPTLNISKVERCSGVHLSPTIAQ
jgi:hypothetical protein